MTPNGKLWAAIRERGMLQKDFARIVGDDPSIVSRIVTGQWNPDAQRKARYSRALGMSVEDLFEE